MHVQPILPGFVAQITGADLRHPSPALAERCFALFDAYPVCVFRETGLDDAAHVAFSRQFGDLERFNPPKSRGTTGPRFDHPELFDVSNLDRDGNIRDDERRRLFVLGNRQWHTDSSFRNERAAYSMLLAHLVPPEGGDTEFADMRAAYAALPEALKARIEPLTAFHTIWHSRRLAGYPEPTAEEIAMLPGAEQPLVLRHPRTGQPSLYLARHLSHIVGLDRAESDALLEELFAHAVRPETTYRHVWRDGDLVVWDNRCTMHRATEFDDTRHKRDMRRTSTYDRLQAQGAVA